MITAQHEGQCLRVAVQTELTIYQVAELHTAASPWLAQPCDWQLDMSEVAEMDGAGLQWLLYVQHCLHDAGHSLVLHAASEDVEHVLQLCPDTFATTPSAS